MSDDFNMSMRGFLKRAGDTGGRSYGARMALTIDGLDVEHVVTGTIKGDV